MESKILLEYRDSKTGLIDMDRFKMENPNVITFSEDRGTPGRDKKWILFDDQRLLVRNEYMNKTNVLYTVYQELVFEELAKQVDFPCAHYDVGKRGDKKCVLSNNILDLPENKGLAMMSLRELMDQLETTDYYDNVYNVADALRAISNHCTCVKLEKEEQMEVMRDFCKMQILDCFLSSSDRHVENISFVYGKDKKTGKYIFKLSPLYDNELSCGSDETKEKIEECINDFFQAKLTANLQNVFATVYESEMSDESQKRNKNNSTGALLEFCMDLDEDIQDFSKKCYDKLNMVLAIKSVENRIGVELPKIYKEFLIGNYMERKNMIKNILDKYYTQGGEK